MYYFLFTTKRINYNEPRCKSQNTEYSAMLRNSISHNVALERVPNIANENQNIIPSDSNIIIPKKACNTIAKCENNKNTYQSNRSPVLDRWQSSMLHLQNSLNFQLSDSDSVSLSSVPSSNSLRSPSCVTSARISCKLYQRVAIFKCPASKQWSHEEKTARLSQILKWNYNTFCSKENHVACEYVWEGGMAIANCLDTKKHDVISRTQVNSEIVQICTIGV